MSPNRHCMVDFFVVCFGCDRTNDKTKNENNVKRLMYSESGPCYPKYKQTPITSYNVLRHLSH